MSKLPTCVCGDSGWTCTCRSDAMVEFVCSNCSRRAVYSSSVGFFYEIFVVFDDPSNTKEAATRLWHGYNCEVIHPLSVEARLQSERVDGHRVFWIDQRRDDLLKLREGVSKRNHKDSRLEAVYHRVFRSIVSRRGWLTEPVIPMPDYFAHCYVVLEYQGAWHSVDRNQASSFEMPNRLANELESKCRNYFGYASKALGHWLKPSQVRIPVWRAGEDRELKWWGVRYKGFIFRLGGCGEFEQEQIALAIDSCYRDDAAILFDFVRSYRPNPNATVKMFEANGTHTIVVRVQDWGYLYELLESCLIKLKG